MKIRVLLSGGALMAFGLCLACLPRDGGDGAPVSPPDARALRNAPFVTDVINPLAVDLYLRLGQERDNVCFSPYSAVAALAMAYGGAQGETEAQMRQVMRIPLDGPAFHAAFAALTYGLYARSRGTAYDLALASAVWGQQDEPFLESYQSLLKTRYGAGALRQVDFRAASDQARDAINQWAADQTGQRIRELIPPETLTPLTRLVLANAIAFQGRWQTPFDAERTRDMPFLSASGETIQVPMMRLRESLRYGANDLVQVLELPYAGQDPAGAGVGGGNDLSMFVVLSRERDGLAAVEAQLSGATLEEWLDLALSPWEVQVFLPRFRVASSFLMNDAFRDLGMTLPFDAERADFSAMTGKADLYVTAVTHSALVEVDEAGTEAAAAAAVVMGIKGLGDESVVFRADHPFLFVIRDNREGTFLFLGRVASPEGHL